MKNEETYRIKWMGHGSATPTWVDRMVILSPIIACSVVWFMVMMEVLSENWMYISSGLTLLYVGVLMVIATGGIKNLFNENGGIGFIILMIGVILGISFIWAGLR